MVRDYSPRRPHRSEDLDSRARPSQSSRRGYDDPPHRDSRYAERERDRDRDKDRDRYGDRRRDERHRERDRDRDEPRASRARDDYSRDYPSRSERDRRGRDRDERDTRERRRDTSRGGPSRRSASPPPRAAPSRSRSAVSRSKSPEDKAKPNFAPSGLLAAATKTVEHKDGTKTVLKYHEPPEARKPVVGWRLYVFKGQEQVDLLHIHRQSAYLIGRDRLVADIPIEHPSCSKQHAVIQFRQVNEKNEFGEVKPVVKPFIIDLESTNGTFVNGEAIPVSRYFELKLSDVIKFGESQREYVLLSEDAA